MSKHSPGPWKWTEGDMEADYEGRALIAADGSPVLYDGEYNQGSNNPANDPLIAAAPEMLELLRELARLPHSGRCPICSATEFDEFGEKQGHSEGCKLGALLKRFE